MVIYEYQWTDGIAMAVKNVLAHESSNSTRDRGAITAWAWKGFQIRKHLFALLADARRQPDAELRTVI